MSLQEILKKQETKLTPELIVKIFKSRCRLLKGCKPYHLRAYVANIWYFSQEMDQDDIMFSRLVDEEELAHILSHHLYADIAAIQLFVGGWPYKGSGVFEHRVTSRPSGIGYTHETVEMASLPLNEQELTLNTFNRSANRLIVTGGHHETLKTAALKYTKVIEAAARSKVINIVFEVNFNSSLSPIFLCARNIILLQLPENAAGIFTLRRKNLDLHMEVKVHESHDKHDNHNHVDVKDHEINGQPDNNTHHNQHHHDKLPSPSSHPEHIKKLLRVDSDISNTHHGDGALYSPQHGHHGPNGKTFERFSEYAMKN